MDETLRTIGRYDEIPNMICYKALNHMELNEFHQASSVFET